MDKVLTHIYTFSYICKTLRLSFEKPDGVFEKTHDMECLHTKQWSNDSVPLCKCKYCKFLVFTIHWVSTVLNLLGFEINLMDWVHKS